MPPQIKSTHDKDFSELLKSNNDTEIHNALCYFTWLSEEQKNELFARLLKFSGLYYLHLSLLKFAWLSKEQREQGFSKLLEAKNANFIYSALRDFPWLSKEQIKNGVEAIRTCPTDSQLHLLDFLLDLMLREKISDK